MAKFLAVLSALSILLAVASGDDTGERTPPHFVRIQVESAFDLSPSLQLFRGGGKLLAEQRMPSPHPGLRQGRGRVRRVLGQRQLR